MVGDDGNRWIGMSTGLATVIGNTKDGYVVEAHISSDVGGAIVDVPAIRVRKRAIETKKTSNVLRVELTKDELIDAGEQAADSVRIIVERKADLDSIKKKINAEIGEAETTLSVQSELVRAGYEMRPVDCIKTLDFDTGKTTETRSDTGEECKPARGLDMSERERELELFPQYHGTVDDADSETESGAATQEPGATVEAVGVTEEQIAAAIQVIKETKRASTSAMQRRLKIGYTLADKVMQALDDRKVIGPPNGSKPREILIDIDGGMTEPIKE